MVQHYSLGSEKMSTQCLLVHSFPVTQEENKHIMNLLDSSFLNSKFYI